MLKNKTIILGVTGGIAAYKAATLVSRLKDLGAEVWVVMTKAATQLMGPLTFRTLSGNPVITDLFSLELSALAVPHIALAEKADLVVLAPCTANIIGKAAQGIADDALTTIIMAATAPKLIAPAMNGKMWRNPAVAKNVQTLKEQGCEFIGPAEGKLACGEEDLGRMAEAEEILERIIQALVPEQDFKGKQILVTAGGTREAIDPVRYLTNRSSGKMGYALAQVARGRGATVTLISANVSLPPPLDIKPVRVESAAGMLEAALAYYPQADAVIMAAAVADYTPKLKNQNSKLKKKESDINLELKSTPDILKTLAKLRSRKNKVLVGFALETENLIGNARAKLKEKDLDLMIANNQNTFESEAIKFSIIDRKGKVENYPQQPKDRAAQVILDRVQACLPK
jgi:phosphopantothenoylcysteine decarboxylase/phosphopantothenate--cysteine ligase